jgi:hypothetical protein
MKSTKKGQKILNALKFQKDVHFSSRHPSPVVKILPKSYPVPKNLDINRLNTQSDISPVKYLPTKDLITHNIEPSKAMNEYLSSKLFSDKLEHKKLQNIESFFFV